MGTGAGAGRPHTDPQVCRGLSPLGLQAGCSVPLRLPRSSTRGRLGWTAAMPASHPSSVFPPPPHTPQHSHALRPRPLPPAALPDAPHSPCARSHSSPSWPRCRLSRWGFPDRFIRKHTPLCQNHCVPSSGSVFSTVIFSVMAQDVLVLFLTALLRYHSQTI